MERHIQPKPVTGAIILPDSSTITTSFVTSKDKKILSGRRQQRHSTEIGSEYHRWWAIRNAVGYETNEHIAGLLLDGFHALLEQIVIMCGGQSYQVQSDADDQTKDESPKQAQDASPDGNGEDDEECSEYGNAIQYYCDTLWKMCGQQDSRLQELDASSQPMQDFIIRLMGYLKLAKSRAFSLNYKKKKLKQAYLNMSSKDKESVPGPSVNFSHPIFQAPILQPVTMIATPSASMVSAQQAPIIFTQPNSMIPTKPNLMYVSTAQRTSLNPLTQQTTVIPTHPASFYVPLSNLQNLQCVTPNVLPNVLGSASLKTCYGSAQSSAGNMSSKNNSESHQKWVQARPAFSMTNVSVISTPCTSSVSSVNYGGFGSSNNFGKSDHSKNCQTTYSSDWKMSNSFKAANLIPVYSNSSGRNHAFSTQPALMVGEKGTSNNHFANQDFWQFNKNIFNNSTSSTAVKHLNFQEKESLKHSIENENSQSSKRVRISNCDEHMNEQNDPSNNMSLRTEAIVEESVKSVLNKTTSHDTFLDNINCYIGEDSNVKYYQSTRGRHDNEKHMKKKVSQYSSIGPISQSYPSLKQDSCHSNTSVSFSSTSQRGPPTMLLPGKHLASGDTSLAPLSSLVQNVEYNPQGTLFKSLPIGPGQTNTKFQQTQILHSSHIDPDSETNINQKSSAKPLVENISLTNTASSIAMPVPSSSIEKNKSTLVPVYINPMGVATIAVAPKESTSRNGKPKFESGNSPQNQDEPAIMSDQNPNKISVAQEENRKDVSYPLCGLPSDYECNEKKVTDCFKSKGNHSNRMQQPTYELTETKTKSDPNSGQQIVTNQNEQSNIGEQDCSSSHQYSSAEKMKHTHALASLKTAFLKRNDMKSLSQKSNKNKDSHSKSRGKTSQSQSRGRRFICNACHIIFFSGTDLLDHRYEQHSFVCGECDGRFLSQVRLEQHKATDHPEVLVCPESPHCRFYTVVKREMEQHMCTAHERSFDVNKSLTSSNNATIKHSIKAEETTKEHKKTSSDSDDSGNCSNGDLGVSIQTEVNSSIDKSFNNESNDLKDSSSPQCKETGVAGDSRDADVASPSRLCSNSHLPDNSLSTQENVTCSMNNVFPPKQIVSLDEQCLGPSLSSISYFPHPVKSMSSSNSQVLKNCDLNLNSSTVLDEQDHNINFSGSDNLMYSKVLKSCDLNLNTNTLDYDDQEKISEYDHKLVVLSPNKQCVGASKVFNSTITSEQDWSESDEPPELVIDMGEPSHRQEDTQNTIEEGTNYGANNVSCVDEDQPLCLVVHKRNTKPNDDKHISEDCCYDKKVNKSDLNMENNYKFKKEENDTPSIHNELGKEEKEGVTLKLRKDGKKPASLNDNVRYGEKENAILSDDAKAKVIKSKNLKRPGDEISCMEHREKQMNCENHTNNPSGRQRSTNQIKRASRTNSVKSNTDSKPKVSNAKSNSKLKNLLKASRTSMDKIKIGQSFYQKSVKEDKNTSDSSYNEKQYFCSWFGCTASYYRKWSLDMHINKVHCGKKLIGCSYEGCLEGFSTKKDLRLHITTEHKGKSRNYVCNWPGCSKRFFAQTHLRVHTFMHTGEKPVACSFCDYRCRQRAALIWHMQRKHGYYKEKNTADTNDSVSESKTDLG